MKIGNVQIQGKVVLAPLAGITDTSFRLLCRFFGAALVFTEMISADGLVRGNTNTLRYLFFQQSERPLGIQIFGSDPEILAKGAVSAAQQKPDMIDINLACPVRKVVKRNAGAALLRDLKLVEKIFRAVVQAVQIPVTIKIRSGWSRESIVAVDVATMAQECGISAVTVHPRTQQMQFSGKADWDLIAQVKEAVAIPVIGSGDITSPLDAANMFNQTGCDAVMIGRASLGQPWIFHHTNHFLKTNELLPQPSLHERFEAALKHTHSALQEKGELLGIRAMRKHLLWYTKGLRESAQLRKNISILETIVDVENLFQEYMQKAHAEVVA
ncbi:MAG: tRNA dihydrouridine synthase DusB [Gemmatimonadota bacterium]|nr:MAG: tRNA dihydrouridine synthase DusB [Gemmatimonadota bacterium]